MFTLLLLMALNLSPKVTEAVTAAQPVPQALRLLRRRYAGSLEGQNGLGVEHQVYGCSLHGEMSKGRESTAFPRSARGPSGTAPEPAASLIFDSEPVERPGAATPMLYAGLDRADADLEVQEAGLPKSRATASGGRQLEPRPSQARDNAELQAQNLPQLARPVARYPTQAAPAFHRHAAAWGRLLTRTCWARDSFGDATLFWV